MMASRSTKRGILGLFALTMSVACSDDSSPPAVEPYTPPPGIEVEVQRPIKLRDETRVPQDDPSFERAEVSADAIAFIYHSRPTIRLEVGHVVVGNGKDPYLRRIVEVVSRSDARVEVKTEAAQLTDAISDGAFRIAGTPNGTDWVVGPESDISGRPVFFGTTIKLQAFDKDKAFNCEVSGGGGFNLSPLLAPAIDRFELDIDIKPTLIPLGAELTKAEFFLDAVLTAGVLAKIERALAAKCELDIAKLIGHKLNIDLSIAFPIGPIPGQLTIKIEPVLKLEAGAEAKVQVTFAPQFTVRAQAGVAYTKAAGWSDTFEVTRTGSLTPTFPDVAGEVSLSAKVSAGLKVATLLYDTAGPFIAVLHFGEGKLAAKLPECTWQATLDIGTDVELGAEVQIPVFDKTILELKKKFNLATLRVKEAEGSLMGCADAGLEAGPEAGLDGGVEAGPDAEPIDAAGDVLVLDAVPQDGPAPDTLPPDAGQSYTSCAAALALVPNAPSGVYWIDPDGDAGASAFETWCDMTFDGGGWTLLAVVNRYDTVRWTTSASWSSATTFGAVDPSGFGFDFKAPGWSTMAWQQLLFEESNGGTKVTTPGSASGSSLQQLFSSSTRVSLVGTSTGWSVENGDLTLPRDQIFFAEIQNPPSTALINTGERNRCIIATAYDGYDLDTEKQDQVEGFGCTAGSDAAQACDNNSCGESSRERDLRIYIR